MKKGVHLLPLLTFEQAMKLKPGDELYQVGQNNADGTPRRWKVNGEVQRWKRDEHRIRVPLKHGLKSYDAITESNFDDEGICPLLATDDQLTEGQMYRITYIGQKGNYRWYKQRFIAKFLYRSSDSLTDEAVFSGRPVFGTSPLSLHHNIIVEIIPTKLAPRVPFSLGEVEKPS